MASMSPADATFASLWSVEDYPACPGGLSYLRQLAETSPRLYAIAEQTDFCDPTDEELKEHPLWLAFLDHYNDCGDCNEV